MLTWTIEKGGAMSQYDTETLRALTADRQRQRLADASAERLARQLRGRPQRRRRPHPRTRPLHARHPRLTS
jgi:hypothetical protein